MVKVARKAQKEWALMPWSERGHILRKAADLIRNHVNEISLWEVRDNGKPIREAKADILSCAETLEYFSGKIMDSVRKNRQRLDEKRK